VAGLDRWLAEIAAALSADWSDSGGRASGRGGWQSAVVFAEPTHPDRKSLPASLLLLNDVTGRIQVCHDPVRTALSDADGSCNVPQPDAWILGDCQQDPRMVLLQPPTRMMVGVFLEIDC
jgi:hypothetical protein